MSRNQSQVITKTSAAEPNHVYLNQNISNHKETKVSQGSVMLKQMSGPLQSGDLPPQNKTLMYFYRTSNLENPGSGDYVVEDTILNLQNKSPRPVIGKEKRFYEINEQMKVNYKDPITFQHI